MKTHFSHAYKVVIVAACVAILLASAAAQEKPVKIGVVTFLSGAAAGAVRGAGQECGRAGGGSR